MCNISSLVQISETVISSKKQYRVAVVIAEDANTIKAVVKCMLDGFVIPIFIGDCNRILKLITETIKQNHQAYEMIKCSDHGKAAEIGVGLVKEGKADIVMKGLINTDQFLKAVLDKQLGIMKPKGILSYVCAIELPKYKKLLFLTDPAVLPFPTFDQKVAMAQYAIDMAHQLGIKKPKVALIGTSEKASPHFPNSQEYQRMCQMAENNEFDTCIMDGPLDIFLACDPQRAKIKGIRTNVGGDADILLFPTLEACNPFYKGLVLFGNGELAGLIQGTTHPVVLMSRSESFKSKYYCLALACLMAENNVNL